MIAFLLSDPDEGAEPDDAPDFATVVCVLVATLVLGLWLLHPLFVERPGRPGPPPLIQAVQP